jgi:FkbM family methyltransferase
MNRVMIFKLIAKYIAKLGLGKSQKVVNLYEEIFSKIGNGIRSDFVIMDGQKLFLDKEDSLMLSIKNNEHELTEIEFLKQIIKNGDTVLDLGANIGVYTLIFAKLVGKSGHVFAFEPDPTNFEILSKNVKENKHENVTLVQKAVSEKNDKIKLFVSKRNHASHRIFDSEEKRNSIEVDVITLDTYFKKNKNPINFIKIDVEGVEGATLLGASNIIKNSKDLVIMMEYFPKWIRKYGMNPEEILDSLIEKKFKLFNIIQKEKKISPINLKNFVKEYNEQKKNYTNVLCVKGKEYAIKN